MPILDDEGNARPAERRIEATAQAAVCGLNPLLLGECRAHRRVGYKNSVSSFHLLTMSKCYKLKRGLMHGTYRPQRGETHEVYEPKYRVTVSSKYPDRVVQAAFVVNYFYQHVIPRLIKNNFACIKGRGVDAAREALKDILRHASMDDWALKADMQNYFASIVHAALYGEICPMLPDAWARAYYAQTVENTGAPVGLDLGSEVYQLSATSLLNRLDHALDSGKYVRYQDDLLFVGSKAECQRALEIIKTEAARLRLTVHPHKTYVQPIARPVAFLGFTYLRHESGRVTAKRLPDKIRHERRKLRHMLRKGVPMARVRAHWQSARECLKKGARGDLCKMDHFTDELFGGMIHA